MAIFQGLIWDPQLQTYLCKATINNEDGNQEANKLLLVMIKSLDGTYERKVAYYLINSPAIT